MGTTREADRMREPRRESLKSEKQKRRFGTDLYNLRHVKDDSKVQKTPKVSPPLVKTHKVLRAGGVKLFLRDGDGDGERVKLKSLKKARLAKKITGIEQVVMDEEVTKTREPTVNDVEMTDVLSSPKRPTNSPLLCAPSLTSANSNNTTTSTGLEASRWAFRTTHPPPAKVSKCVFGHSHWRWDSSSDDGFCANSGGDSLSASRWATK